MAKGSAAASSAHDWLAALVATRPGGWGRPKAYPSAHLFDAGAMLSVCGRALYFGETTAEPGRTKKCPACWRAELEGANHGQV
jgi:hypothetical protein